MHYRNNMIKSVKLGFTILARYYGTGVNTVKNAMVNALMNLLTPLNIRETNHDDVMEQYRLATLTGWTNVANNDLLIYFCNVRRLLKLYVMNCRQDQSRLTWNELIKATCETKLQCLVPLMVYVSKNVAETQHRILQEAGGPLSSSKYVKIHPAWICNTPTVSVY